MCTALLLSLRTAILVLSVVSVLRGEKNRAEACTGREGLKGSTTSLLKVRNDWAVLYQSIFSSTMRISRFSATERNSSALPRNVGLQVHLWLEKALTMSGEVGWQWATGICVASNSNHGYVSRLLPFVLIAFLAKCSSVMLRCIYLHVLLCLHQVKMTAFRAPPPIRWWPLNGRPSTWKCQGAWIISPDRWNWPPVN